MKIYFPNSNELKLSWTDKWFPFVVTLDVTYSALLPQPDRVTLQSMGSLTQEKLISKIADDTGIVYKDDYIFADDALGESGHHPLSDAFPINPTIKMRKEEHYTMFKLHYHG